MSEIPTRYLAWRRACLQGGRVCSPLFDTPEEAADWLTDANREDHDLTLVELRLAPAPAKAIVTAIACAHNNRRAASNDPGTRATAMAAGLRGFGERR